MEKELRKAIFETLTEEDKGRLYRELSQGEYDFWTNKLEKYLGKKVWSIELYKDEIGNKGIYYRKDILLQDNKE